MFGLPLTRDMERNCRPGILLVDVGHSESFVHCPRPADEARHQFAGDRNQATSNARLAQRVRGHAPAKREQPQVHSVIWLVNKVLAA